MLAASGLAAYSYLVVSVSIRWASWARSAGLSGSLSAATVSLGPAPSYGPRLEAPQIQVSEIAANRDNFPMVAGSFNDLSRPELDVPAILSRSKAQYLGVVLGDPLDHAENMARRSGVAIIDLPQDGPNRRLASVEGRRSADYLLWLG